MFLLFTVSSAQTGPQKVLHTFTGGVDGGQPYQAGVIFDPAGNLYGVTQLGGAYGQGAVFQLNPSPGGTWTENVLYSFIGAPDGERPQGGLIIDGAGNLYGTTSSGGDSGCGTVFKLAQSDSSWAFTVLYSFAGGQDGCSPQSDLSFLPDGYIFGTTAGGGLGSQGTAFRLSTSGTGYVYSSFQGSDGKYPGGMNSWGYGTTYYGGKEQVGNIFEPVHLGNNQINVEHVFTTVGEAGYFPAGDLATQVNADGVWIMYGTTSWGGVGGRGTVYQLTQNALGGWSISVLHSFSGPDGSSPWAGPVLDAAGNLYGTTQWGGPENAGTVFKLTPGTANKWAQTVLYNFTGGTDGSVPTSGVVLDSAGNLYGTTLSGGASNQGVVYEVVKTTAVLEPASLTFGPQPLHTTSPAQQISLFNTSPIPITVTNVNVQGDFAISANECQSPVQPNSYCAVYVTFTPTGAGTAPRTGAITFVDATFNSPQSAQLSGTVPYPSKTSVTTSGSPSFVGQSVTFTATVTPTHGTIPDGELVTFREGSTTLGSAALASGTAAFTTSSLAAKLYAIKATYVGDPAFLASTGSVAQVVDLYPTTTALGSSSNPSAYKQAVTFTATVTPTGPYPPTGKIMFKDGTTGIGTVTVTDGVATLTKSNLTVGTHAIRAEYLGDADSARSTSAVLYQVVE